MFVYGKLKLHVPVSVVKFIFLQSFVWLLYSIFYRDSAYLIRILLLLITLFLLEIDIKQNKNGLSCTYVSWLTIQSLLGLVGFILVLAGILEPIFEFQELDERTGYFFGLFTTNAYRDGLIRIAGFFDEPGAFANWGVIALWINKLYKNNTKIERILLFGLLTTLSLAYFIQVVIYVYTFNRKNTWKVFLFLILTSACVLLIAMQNEALYEAVLGRLVFDSATGEFSGDNRSELMERAWNVFIEHPIFGVGGSNLLKLSEKIGFMGANFFSLWAADGIVGQIISWLPLFYLFSLRKKKEEYGYMFLMFVVGFIHRPYDPTQLLYPLSLYVVLVLASKDCGIGLSRKKKTHVLAPHH